MPLGDLTAAHACGVLLDFPSPGGGKEWSFYAEADENRKEGSVNRQVSKGRSSDHFCKHSMQAGKLKPNNLRVGKGC